MHYNFYIDDLKLGAVCLSERNGCIPAPSPKANQLLVIVVEEISFEMSPDE